MITIDDLPDHQANAIFTVENALASKSRKEPTLATWNDSLREVRVMRQCAFYEVPVRGFPCMWLFIKDRPGSAQSMTWTTNADYVGFVIKLTTEFMQKYDFVRDGVMYIPELLNALLTEFPERIAVIDITRAIALRLASQEVAMPAALTTLATLEISEVA